MTPPDPGLSLWARLLTDAGRLGPRTTLLDVGGGSGELAAAVARASGARAVLADPSARSVVLPAVRARAEALPFRDATFEAVLFSHVLHHFSDPPAALREAARVLAPGGRLLVRTAAPEDLRRLPHGAWIPHLLDALACVVPSLETLHAWLHDAGLSIVRQESVETPQAGELSAWIESVALQAWRDWAMSPTGGPDPRDPVRAWARARFTETPPVPETLLVAMPACPGGLE